MEKLVFVACLALAALCVSASPPAKPRKPSLFKQAAELDLETCAKQILDDFLSIPVPLAVENKHPISQVRSCSEWFGGYSAHLGKFGDCSNRYGGKIMESVNKIHMSGTQQQLYARRVKTHEFCHDFALKVTDLLGEHAWRVLAQTPEPATVNETLSAKTCAQTNLLAMESFKLPKEFKNWSRDEQANYCEEAEERSDEHPAIDCNAQYRMSHYLPFYEEEDMKSYNEIKEGYKTCEQFFTFTFNWSSAEEKEEQKE